MAFSLPRGVDVDSSWLDTACPVQPEASSFTPEAPEGFPSPADILAVSPGAPATSFPMEQRIEVHGFPGISPAIISLMSVAAHQQRGSYDQWMMRRSLRIFSDVRGCRCRESSPRMSVPWEALIWLIVSSLYH